MNTELTITTERIGDFSLPLAVLYAPAIVRVLAPTPKALQTLHITAADGSEQLLAQGYTFERQLQVTTEAGSQAWTERVLLVRMERLRQPLCRARARWR